MCNILSLWEIFQQKLAKKEVGTIDRSRDIERLQEFYKLYREKNNVDKLREEEIKLRESGAFSGNLGEYVSELANKHIDHIKLSYALELFFFLLLFECKYILSWIPAFAIFFFERFLVGEGGFELWISLLKTLVNAIWPKGHFHFSLKTLLIVTFTSLWIFNF